MAFIEIIVTPNGQAACKNYFFREGIPNTAHKIEVGEVAYIPDDQLDEHLDRGFVRQITMAKLGDKVVVNEDERPKPGRKANADQPGP